ncbi:hypothetical protein RB653_008676 [Dictyostelium firmibasis]|uniref:non-specific serine/threonine protein kinase n=1 Tax=Dictyostelium firmibasis TaxID=79012 RepID=A0AAN7U531_9MYCE
MGKNIIIGSTSGSIHKSYEIGSQIGNGKFAQVHSGTNKSTGKKSAIKIMKKSIVEESAIIKEVEMMTEINHQNIIKLQEVYETDNEVLLVLELVTGGELFDKIVEREFYTEQDASTLICTVTKVIQYLHSKDIVHCDLKPENLLYSDNSDQAIIKLCDFGLSQRCGSGNPLRSLVGTLTYMAPEISSCTGYGKPVDLWSIGVISYILLCGFPPFDESTGYILEFPSPEWDNISDSAKSLIKGLLNNDPSKRFTIDQTLKHPWIAGTSCGKNSIVGTLKTLREFNTLRRTNGGNTTMGHNKQSRSTVFELFPSLTPIKSNDDKENLIEFENNDNIKINLNNENNNNVILENDNLDKLTTTTTTATTTSTTTTTTTTTIIDDSVNKTKIQLMNSLDFENDSSSSETYSSSSPIENGGGNDKFTSPELLSSLSIDLGCASDQLNDKEKIIEQLKNEKSLLQKELLEIKRQSPVPSPSSSFLNTHLQQQHLNNSNGGSTSINNGNGTIERQFRPIHMSKDSDSGSYENLLLGSSPLIKAHNNICHSRNSSFGYNSSSGGCSSSDESTGGSFKKDKSKYGVDRICLDLQSEFEKLSLPKETIDKLTNVLSNYKQKNQEKSLKIKLDKQKEKYKKLKAQLKKDKLK